MNTLIVVNNPNHWPLVIEGAEIVQARTYLTRSEYSHMRNTRVFNLCKTYKYQTVGYYVSLLAEARGHKPMPTTSTILDFGSQAMIRYVSEDLDDLIQKSLGQIHGDEFILSIYFGKNLAKKYDRLSRQLFNFMPAPFLRAKFRYSGKWQMQNINPISANEIPDEHIPFVLEVTRDYFAGKRLTAPKRTVSVYDIAILYDPREADSPSDEKAIQHFIKAAEKLNMGAEVISKEDYGRLGEYDALFIRETTAVNHHTYRFARKALAGGLVVIDDPVSILKCTNKVFLTELLERHEIPIPKTMIVHKNNLNLVENEIGLPCILKQPDSSFSLGVWRAETSEQLQEGLAFILNKSDLVIAQEYIPTPFDWRIGVLDQKPLFACKYYMARNHWQIIKRGGGGRISYGKVETLPVDQAPGKVVKTALKAANLIGNGLYGIDIKERENSCNIIEINDNPSIESGDEDSVLKEELYLTIMRVFLNRLDTLRNR